MDDEEQVFDTGASEEDSLVGPIDEEDSDESLVDDVTGGLADDEDETLGEDDEI